MTPLEAQALAAIVEEHRKTLELADIKARLAQLEAGARMSSWLDQRLAKLDAATAAGRNTPLSCRSRLMPSRWLRLDAGEPVRLSAEQTAAFHRQPMTCDEWSTVFDHMGAEVPSGRHGRSLLATAVPDELVETLASPVRGQRLAG